MYRIDSSWFWPGDDLPNVFLNVPDVDATDLPEVLPLQRFLRSLPDVTTVALPVWMAVERRHEEFRERLASA